MSGNILRLSRAIAAAFGAIIVSGCDLTAYIISHDITHYQQAAAKAGNNLLLQNIIRAGFNEPLQFQEVTQVHGAAALGGSIMTSFPFGRYLGASSGVNSFTGAATISSQPSFDLGTASNQEFFAAISQPVQPSALQQLFLAGLDSWAVTELVFADEVSGRVAGEGIRLKQTTFLQPLGPLLSTKTVSDLKVLSDLDSAKHRLRPAQDGYQLYDVRTGYILCSIASDGKQTALGALAGLAADIRDVDACSDTASPIVGGGKSEKHRGPSYPLLRARSVFEMIQFLGRRFVAKPTKGSDYAMPPQPCGNRATLFNPDPAGGGDVVAEAEHGSHVYRIHGGQSVGNCDSTAETFTALSHLFNLHKNTTGVATTPVIRPIL